MGRKKAVKSEDDLYLADGDVVQDEDLELDRTMRDQGFSALSEGAYRRLPRGLSDEANDMS